MKPVNNFSPPQQHLQAMRQKLLDLLGADYDFVKQRESDGVIYFNFRCLYYSHNDKHFDENPSA